MEKLVCSQSLRLLYKQYQQLSPRIMVSANIVPFVGTELQANTTAPQAVMVARASSGK